MKIRYGIARGYKAEINGSASPEEWVNGKYAPWIKKNITEAFTIGDVTASDFIIDFAKDDDAKAFQKDLGGKFVE